MIIFALGNFFIISGKRSTFSNILLSLSLLQQIQAYIGLRHKPDATIQINTSPLYILRKILRNSSDSSDSLRVEFNNFTRLYCLLFFVYGPVSRNKKDFNKPDVN